MGDSKETLQNEPVLSAIAELSKKIDDLENSVNAKFETFETSINKKFEAINNQQFEIINAQFENI